MDPDAMYLSNDPDGDADCLAALQQVEQAAVMNDPYSTYFSDGPEGDADCVAALDAAEQEQLAYPLEFQLVPHVDRRVRKFGLHRRVFTTRLVQRGGALRPELIPRDQLPSLLDQALQIAIQRQVLDQPGVHENDDLMINMSSNRLQHAYQSSRVRVRDWLQDTEPAQMMMQQISKILNSNENFAIDDSFHIEVSHIRDSGVGSGSRGQRPGTQPIEQFLRDKKSVVRIENDDELCCARALVTAKAYRDWGARHWQYRNLAQGRPGNSGPGTPSPCPCARRPLWPGRTGTLPDRPGRVPNCGGVRRPRLSNYFQRASPTRPQITLPDQSPGPLPCMSFPEWLLWQKLLLPRL